MKYCSHCGKEIADEAVVCPNCGCAAPSSEPDIPSAGLNVLSFLIPLVGLILYIVNCNTAPNKAKAIGKWALIGLVTVIVLNSILLAI